ncbi:Alpha-D-GlcNAc alpha-1,2-L-rhamnosyltransferase [Pacificimonas flava]|uniref:Alpha-D-GlcNAc alpha-1,2-L-rhamnosyltransferase n=1 Tax=Pacificimonas flava TaxID=1234595 RepID=M2U8N8_9SPHN|nr:glycosyltransferase family 4 protein [Pacificimonas flava]EMD84327.1 Alpha-D-GlcNAc alpha-1,2-L-rhamnosyltransferase [Pacificimonas flava]
MTALSPRAAARRRIFVTGLRGLPGVMGGVETHCEELLPRIGADNPDLSFCVLGRQPYLPDASTEFQGIEVVALSSPKKVSLEAIVSTARSVWYARSRGADLMHIHAVGPALLVPAARLLGLRTVMTHHGADYDRAKWGRFAKAMLRLGERLGVRFANRIIAVSPSLERSLRRRYPAAANKISYIPNGAPTIDHDESGQDEALRKLGLRAGQFILAVGRLVPEKAFHDLIDAHADSGDTRTLVIVGAADHASDYAAKLQSRASASVIFAGRQPRSMLAHLYRTADLFVLPSYHEGLPISALEAGQAGANMLLSDIPANVDIGLEERNYFPVGDKSALAACLRRPGGDFAIDAAALAKRFDWSRIAEQTASVYRAAMSG